MSFTDVSLARRYKDSKQAVAVESELQNIGITTVKDKHVFDFSIDEYPSSFVTQAFTVAIRTIHKMSVLTTKLLLLFLCQSMHFPKWALFEHAGA
jgi:hypothetical protein